MPAKKTVEPLGRCASAPSSWAARSGVSLQALLLAGLEVKAPAAENFLVIIIVVAMAAGLTGWSCCVVALKANVCVGLSCGAGCGR